MHDLKSIDLSIIDPPYNNGTIYKHYNDKRKDYIEWCKQWFKICKKISKRIIITPGHGNLWMWGKIEKPWGIGAWYKPGNPASSVLGWVCWEPWIFYTKDYKALGGPDTIQCSVSKQKNTGNHPCPKPLKLIANLIEKASKKNQLIMDPFLGSGTTAVACERLNRKWIGIEEEEEYCQISIKRIEQERKQLKLFY